MGTIVAWWADDDGGGNFWLLLLTHDTNVASNADGISWGFLEKYGKNCKGKLINELILKKRESARGEDISKGNYK